MSNDKKKTRTSNSSAISPEGQIAAGVQPSRKDGDFAMTAAFMGMGISSQDQNSQTNLLRSSIVYEILINRGVPTKTNEHGEVIPDVTGDWKPVYENINRGLENRNVRFEEFDGVPRTVDDLLEYITSVETRGGKAPGDYNIVHSNSQNHFRNYSNQHFEGRQLTQLTIGEVLEWQEARGNFTAAGGPQFINKTLQGLVDQLDIPLNTVFDEALQKRLAVVLLERRGLSSYMNGDIKLHEFQDRLAMEWASLKNSKGVGHYDGDSAGNRGYGDANELRQHLAGLTAAPSPNLA